MERNSPTTGQADGRVESQVDCDPNCPVESERDGVVPSEGNDSVGAADLQGFRQFTI
jgi:hypothetical protein